nr:ribonuclease E/G [Psychromicrobium sp. YIM S02556]
MAPVVQEPGAEQPAAAGEPEAASPAVKAPRKTRTRATGAGVTATKARKATSTVGADTTDADLAVSEVLEVVESATVEATVVDDAPQAPARKAASRKSSRSRKAAVPADSELPSESDVEAEIDAELVEVTALEQPLVAEEPVVEAQNDEAPNDELPSAAPLISSPFALPTTGPGVPLATEPLFHAPDLSQIIPVRQSLEAQDGEENDSEAGSRRRRSRSRRTSVSASSAETGLDAEDSEGESGQAAADDSGEGFAGVEESSSRRRRRRRRGDADLELRGGVDDDPPNTVTRVRAPRVSSDSGSNRVVALRGSTRLEAKKQRRRESRETGRRRQGITEAEFLARRESVDRVMVVRQRDERIQIGVLEDGILAEHFVSKTQQDSLIGNVYLGKVQNVLPSMEAAFVDIGRGRNAVLYAGEVDWNAAKLDGAPRRIENALKSGDTVLVQVTKDPVGHKGARLTSQISLPGRYLVYVPGGSMTGISRKLPDVERNRLKRILKDNLPEHAGVIVRTAAEGASEEELTHDINRLRAQWEGIESQASSTKTLAPELLYGEPDLTIKVVRDVFNEDFSKLIISGEEAWDTVEAYVTYVAPDLVDRLEKWTAEEDIFAAHRIEEQISKALERKVFLPSGGSLVIDRTEAMTVVDVNTGKFTGSGGNLEETVTKNNLEAAEEVVRQLRLRDIGGIIVIDFIDMVLESNRDLVLRRLVECLGRDRTKHQVAEVTSLGLVQMTRKRMGTGLLEVFGEQCEACAGRGVVTHEEPVEHRRSNSGPESHRVDQQRSEAQRDGSREGQRSSRNERKRSRNRGAGAPSEPAEEMTEAEKAAKAQAARVALATIAAAAAATHHEATGHDADQHHEMAEDSSAEHTAPATPPSAADRDAVRLTFGGEEVAVPRGSHASGSEESGHAALTLDVLADVFEHLAPSTAEAPAASSPSASASTAPAASSSSRARRGRRQRAGRAQGAAGSNAVETMGGGEQTSQGATLQAAAAPAAERAKRTPAAEPMILGVGVPASEL